MDKNHISDLIFNKLNDNKDVLTKSFADSNNLTSTKYFILDDLLPEQLVYDAYAGFPSKNNFYYRNTFREKKFTFAKLNELSSPIPEIITDSFQDPKILKIIGEIVKINNLEADSSLYAGGLSRMDKSHFLNPHIDNSHNADRTKYRRLNLLFYVTPDIDEKDGGNFELWDSRVKTPLKIISRFNRLVVMETTTTSWHSVDPVKSNIKRCCVSNYYFTKKSPEEKDYYHVTSFTGRPNQMLLRLYGTVDNFIRQTVSTFTGKSRGKHLRRDL